MLADPAFQDADHRSVAVPHPYDPALRGRCGDATVASEVEARVPAMKSSVLEISRTTARRYLLGRQGLWPGRRWAGSHGATEAVRALGSVQVDPVARVAPSQDLVLRSRVEGYRPGIVWDTVYRERRLFEYGGHLDIYPVEELPYWRVHMERRRDDPRVSAFFRDYAAMAAVVFELVRDHGPTRSRDLSALGAPRVMSGRASDVAGLALYNLWLVGVLMICGRDSKEKVYDLAERVAPAGSFRIADPDEAERHFERGALQAGGLITARRWSDAISYRFGRPMGVKQAAPRLDALLAAGEAVAVRVEGSRQTYYTPADGVSLLARLERGEAPWTAIGPPTDQEAAFLSPLDNLLERDRLKDLFGFEHLWEIYKKPAQRRFGVYTMPILYRDRLVGRIDPRMDRANHTLVMEGVWWEEPSMAADAGIRMAFDRAITRFAAFHGATDIHYAQAATTP